MKNRPILSVFITTVLIGFPLLISDFFNSKSASYLKGIFSIGSLLFIIGLGAVLYILLVPSYALIENKFKSSTFFFKLLLYILIAIILSPIVTLIVEHKLYLDIHITSILIGSFIVFSLLNYKKQVSSWCIPYTSLVNIMDFKGTNQVKESLEE